MIVNKQLDAILRRMHQDRVVRKAIVKRRPDMFAAFYFEHYLEFDIAPMHREMFGLMTGDQNLAVITGFRGSAKSTFMSLFHPIYSVISGRVQFPLIITKTQVLAKQLMKNMKDELEQNALLRADMGPFETSEDVWGASVISLSKYHAQIMVISRDQAIRGIRYRQFRPQLIIIDDADDLESVKTQESRDDTWRWLSSTIIPLGTPDTKVLVIGTPLHEDSLIMRLKKAIEGGARDGIYKNYPIIDENGNPLWPGKFPTPADIEKERRRIGDAMAWDREYLLRIVSEETCVVRPEWIQYYKQMPPREGNPRFIGTLLPVDLAISKESSADCTAITPISVFRDRDGNWSAYVHPHPVNERLDFPEARQRLKELSRSFGCGSLAPLYIESVAYQSSMPQELRHEGFPAYEFQVHGQDKRMRLSVKTHLIQDGIIRFPEQGAETLINQLVGFGTERHDDLADAFAIGLHRLAEMMSGSDVVFPKINKPTPEEEADPQRIKDITEAELWLADRKAALDQGNINHFQYLDSQEVVLRVKLGVPWANALRFVTGVMAEEEKQKLEDKGRSENWREDFKKTLEKFGNIKSKNTL